MSAGSSTVGPRPVFTKIALRFIDRKCSSVKRCWASGVAGACMETMSERCSSSLRPTGSTPYWLMTSSSM